MSIVLAMWKHNQKTLQVKLFCKLDMAEDVFSTIKINNSACLMVDDVVVGLWSGYMQGCLFLYFFIEG